MNSKIFYKNPAEIKKIAEGATILSEIVALLLSKIAPGVSGIDLEQVASEEIQKRGLGMAFKGYMGYPANLIVCINDEVVHCIPNDRKFKEGDLVTIDFGVKYKGFFTDMARSVVVGRNKQAQKLIDATKLAFDKSLPVLTPGRKLIDAGREIASVASKFGFGIVKETTGHGIGRSLHEDPVIFNFPHPSMNDVELKPGMVICVEPVFTFGYPEIGEGDDGWRVYTKDGSLAAHWENMVAITKSGPKVLTF